MKEVNFVKITCPYCKAEYTLDEIYIGKYITGHSKDIIKDPTGKIIATTWVEEPDITESFKCDYCNKEFEVELEIKAGSKEIDDMLDFSKGTVSLI